MIYTHGGISGLRVLSLLLFIIIKEFQSSLLGNLNLGKGTPRTTSKIAFIGLGSLFCENIRTHIAIHHKKQRFTQEKFWGPNSELAYRGELGR